MFVRTRNMDNHDTKKDTWTEPGMEMGWEKRLSPVPMDGLLRYLRPEHTVGWSPASVGFKCLSRQHFKIRS